MHHSVIYGIVGIMNVMGVNFLVLIDGIQNVGQLNKSPIYKISQTKFVEMKVSSLSLCVT